jgi:hypothetical protein
MLNPVEFATSILNVEQITKYILNLSIQQSESSEHFFVLLFYFSPSFLLIGEYDVCGNSHYTSSMWCSGQICHLLYHEGWLLSGLLSMFTLWQLNLLSAICMIKVLVMIWNVKFTICLAICYLHS